MTVSTKASRWPRMNARSPASPSNFCAGRERALRVDRRCRPRSTRPALSDRVEVLEREPERIHRRVAVAHAGFFRCCSSRSRTDAGLPPSPRSGRPGTFGGGGGGGLPRRFSSTHLPAQHRRRARRIRRERQQAALAEQPAAVRAAGERDAAELLAVDVRDPVVPGQPLVDERVVRRQELDHAAVLAQLCFDEQLGLPPHRAAQAARRSPGTSARSARRCAMLRSCSHWPAKFSTSALAFGSASMRRTCWASVAGSCSLPRSARSSSSSSGMLLQRKNDSRDASSRSLIRYAAPGATFAGSRSTRNRKFGIGEDPFERELDAGVEAFAAAGS